MKIYDNAGVSFKPFNTAQKVLVKVGWLLLVIASCYAIWRRIPKYFIGSVYLPHRSWLYLHIICGLVAMICGPLQFIDFLRTKNINIHRSIGKIYLVAVLVGSIAAFFLAWAAQKHFIYATGLGTLAVVCFTSAVMGYHSIRRKQIALHQKWMIRSYIAIVSFTVFPLSQKALVFLRVSTVENIVTFLSWFSWIIPLLIFEFALQTKNLKCVRYH